jgi:hypothetical protein
VHELLSARGTSEPERGASLNFLRTDHLSYLQAVRRWSATLERISTALLVVTIAACGDEGGDSSSEGASDSSETFDDASVCDPFCDRLIECDPDADVDSCQASCTSTRPFLIQNGNTQECLDAWAKLYTCIVEVPCAQFLEFEGCDAENKAFGDLCAIE